MNGSAYTGVLFWTLHILVQIALVVRVLLRSHRDPASRIAWVVVIDDTITYCGSQNCADPEFLVKAKYAPWVDAVMRFEGPVL